MNESYLTPPLTMPAFWAQSEQHPRKDFELLSPRLTPTRRLTTVERATVSIELSGDTWVLGRGILFEAAARLRVFERRGLLPYLSGQSIADTFQTVYWYPHPSRRSLRGWDLLRALDEADEMGVEVWLSAIPHGESDYQRMRMRERIAQIAPSKQR